MSTHRTVNRHAAAKTGITLDEMAKFVAEAQNEGVGPTSRVTALVGWGGKLKELHVEDETYVTPPEDQHQWTQDP